MQIVNITLECDLFHAYILDSSLLLFSEKSEQVYGFEKEDAALFLKIDSLLEEGKSKEEIIEEFSSLPQDFVKTLYVLASCEESVQKEMYGQKLEFASYKPDILPRVYYAVNDLTFAVNYPNSILYKQIHPVLEHLSAEKPTPHLISVDFQPKEENWEILFNQNSIAYDAGVTKLALILQENMIIAQYQFAPYLIAIHAAAVEYSGNLFIMPASSGSGKTTLTAASMREGFSLYSDEISTIDTQGNIASLPFALNIKEGSWSVLKKVYPRLEQTRFHIRFDEQKVRFLTPQKREAKRRKPTHLVFPTYKAGASTSLLPLSACNAMNRIKEAGYQLDSPLNQKSFEDILNYLIVLPKYSLEYSSLPEAIQILKEVTIANN